jgi:CRISPR-associated protein Csm3
MKELTLYGRIILTGRVRAVSGLHIGGSPGALAIGNVDMPVIRDAVTNRPYIPGSSLKGKMRSLAEKLTGAPQNQPIGKDVNIHIAKSRQEYERFWVNPVFGVPGADPSRAKDFEVPAPTRLVVRDVPLDDESAQKLQDAKTDLPFSEVKWEAAIDRVTAAATPRQIERVPAGAIFRPLELVFSVYQPGDLDLFPHVLTALQLVEDDYLGGQGSRGSGKVAFEELRLAVRRGAPYADAGARDLPGLSEADRKGALVWLKQTLPVS